MIRMITTESVTVSELGEANLFQLFKVLLRGVGYDGVQFGTGCGERSATGFSQVDAKRQIDKDKIHLLCTKQLKISWNNSTVKASQKIVRIFLRTFLSLCKGSSVTLTTLFTAGQHHIAAISLLSYVYISIESHWKSEEISLWTLLGCSTSGLLLNFCNIVPLSPKDECIIL